ncbi:hypothetical protein HPB51_022271 [Rhipicephalus microplus]|uniref:Uncharacterized protein n=1 Tax=Rhipicephalus microplus TaxID=6941 RepID=A0A9J6ECM8_RHIMP|nr:hypothetical protein HPB51_022271 [Rhipicephalus microplus]
MSGDVEENPGPPKEDTGKQYNELISLIKGLHSKIDAKHEELMESINEVREAQVSLEQKVAELDNRLCAVEECVRVSDSEPNRQRVPEVLSVNKRLDELEDRSRRENLIFYGIEDCDSETWAQSEEKICQILNETLKLNLGSSDDRISRAHRLGRFVVGKSRPVIVKFASFKFRESMLQSRSSFRESHVSISEDFCRATRSVRKKLFEFGRASGEKYTVKYNKLYINKKCFMYSPVTDSVCELHTNAQNSSEASSSATHADEDTLLS